MNVSGDPFAGWVVSFSDAGTDWGEGVSEVLKKRIVRVREEVMYSSYWRGLTYLLMLTYAFIPFI